MVCVPVRLANLTPVEIHQGTRVARVERLDEAQISAVLDPTMSETVSPQGPEVTPEKQRVLWEAVECTAADVGLSEREELYGLLLRYADIFASGSGDLGRTGMLKHSIDVGDSRPIRQAARRVPPYRREEVHRQLQDMLQRDVIKPSTSSWASPVVLVQKKDGSIRFCIDYRRVNAVTRKDAYHLPRIDDTLDTLAGSEWFSTLDLLCGYWQVEVAKQDQEKTAFTTKEGLYESKVMPFGLCNAPATFQRLMDLVLAGVQWTSWLVYQDDIIIFGRTFEAHLKNLQMVVEQLRQAGL